MKAIVFDCEIVKAIQGKGETKMESIEYCDGWSDFVGMGISVIGCYDYAEDRYRVFLKDNFSRFRDLVDSSDVVCGWNSFGFDEPLVKAVCGIEIPKEKSYDLRKLIGMTTGDGKYVKGNLGEWGKINDCGEKSGQGILAPVLWQRGHLGEVIDYCLADVRVTKNLIDRVLLDGFLKNPYGLAVHLVKPW